MSVIIGDFDVSGLTIDPRTGKMHGPVVSRGGTPLKYLDFPLAAQLCQCCGIELLRSGSKWSVWFCAECAGHVRKLNESVGAIVFPVGRHTIMNQLGLSGDATRDPVKVRAFAASTTGLFRSMDRLHEWADEVVRRNCADGPLADAETVPIATYLATVASLSRRAAFDAMCEYWLAKNEPGGRFGHAT